MRKKLFFLTLIVVLSFNPIFSQTYPETSWRDYSDISWFSEEESEFDISTAEEFAGLSELVETGENFLDKTINITADIDLDEHLWIPIGKDNDFLFSGTVNGNGNTISNLWITGLNRDFIGLFGQTENATFTDIYLDTVNIDETGGDSGALVANMFANGLIENCHVSNAEVKNLGASVGGLNGSIMTESYIKRSSFSGNVTGENQVGGLTSQAWDKSGVSESYAEGTVTGEYIVGGLIGFGTMAFEPNRESTIENCYSRMDVVATDPVGMAGGIYGNAQMAVIIKNVYSTGTVEAENLAGAFIGEAGGIVVENSYFDEESSEMENALGNNDSEIEVFAKTTEEMKTEEFTAVLNQDDSDGPWGYDSSINDAYPSFWNTDLSLDKVEFQADLTLFPTMVETEFTLESSLNLQAYEIYNMSGQKVVEGNLEGQNAVVEVNTLSSGIYLVNVKGENFQTVKRIVKK